MAKYSSEEKLQSVFRYLEGKDSDFQLRNLEYYAMRLKRMVRMR